MTRQRSSSRTRSRPKRSRLLYVVIGPPAAGKSTWVRERAKAGDITIDFDAIANTLTPQGEGSHQHTPEVAKVTKAARQAAIDTAIPLSSTIDVYLIHSTPSDKLLSKYRAAGGQIVTVDPGREVVLARAKSERPWWMQGAIKRWYEERPAMSVGAKPDRGGHRWRQLRGKFKAQCAERNDLCWICGQEINYTAPAHAPASFEADHAKPVATHPHLELVIGNLRPAHSSCNRSRGAKAEVTGEWVNADW